MPNYLITYKGHSTNTADMTPEQEQEVMQKWGEWMARVGEALVNVGNPIGEHRTSIVDDGTEGDPVPLSGYSVVAADDLEGAKAHVKGHPFLSDGNGEFAIDIYELAPLPEM